MKKSYKVLLAGLAAVSIFGLAACSQSGSESAKKDKKIDFILDWSPNTNHTGLYVAQEKGYFKEAGVDVDIKLPPEDFLEIMPEVLCSTMAATAVISAPLSNFLAMESWK